jgi:phage shock protein A
MQTVDRAKLIVRAHVNDLLAKAEDTRQTRLLALEEMRQDIRSVKSLVAHAITDLKLMERKLDETEAEATRWEEKAVFALKKGEEDLARRALVRKCELMKRGNQYREQLATQREAIDSLKASLKTLEVKLDIMPYRSVPKLAVAESREEQRQLVVSPTTSVHLVSDASAFDAYDQMVERVQYLEAHAEALAELIGGDDLEQKFFELENKDKVEKDLVALKVKIAAENRSGSPATQ